MRVFALFVATISIAAGVPLARIATELNTPQSDHGSTTTATTAVCKVLNCPGMVNLFELDNYQTGASEYMEYLIDNSELQHKRKDKAECYAIRPDFTSSIFLKTRLDRKPWGCELWSAPDCRGQNMWVGASRPGLDRWRKKAKSMRCYLG